MTIYDLEWLDLAYAPPFSSAKDPVNQLATTAANMLRGDHPTFRWNQVDAKSFLLDVRTQGEFSRGTISSAVNIPVDELRTRLSELPKDGPIYLFCQEGLRGYIAVRLLKQNGFDARNLLGGYKLWQIATANAK
jgi:rhodanese-related sulfurtransferase